MGRENKKLSRCQAEGFTVIELILVVALLSVTALALGSASFTQDNFASYNARLKTMGDIRYAQQMALISGEVYGFRTLSNHSYEIYRGSPGTPATDPLTRGAMTVDLYDNFNNVTFASTAYHISFGAGGAPTMGGGADYTLSASGVGQVFHVEAGTGFLKSP